MNISAVSFHGENTNKKTPVQIPDFVRSENMKKTHLNYNIKNTSDLKNDQFQKTQKKSKNNTKNSKPIKYLPAKSFIAGTLFALGLGTVVSAPNRPAAATIPFNCEETSLDQIAQTYNSDAEFIKKYNGIDENTDLATVTEVKVPAKYDYMGENIEKLQDELYKPMLSDEKREEIESEIEEKEAIHSAQQKLADIYSDGAYVIYDVKLPDDIKESNPYGLNIEVFKDVFGIEDGAIRNNNDIDYTWDKDDHGGFRNYSTETLHDGSIIKVPLSGISTDLASVQDDIEE